LLLLLGVVNVVVIKRRGIKVTMYGMMVIQLVVLELLLWDRWLWLMMLVLIKVRLANLEVLEPLASMLWMSRPSASKLHGQHRIGLVICVRVAAWILEPLRTVRTHAVLFFFVIAIITSVIAITVRVKSRVFSLDLLVGPVEVHQLTDLRPLTREAESSRCQVEGFAFVLGPGLGVLDDNPRVGCSNGN